MNSLEIVTELEGERDKLEAALSALRGDTKPKRKKHTRHLTAKERHVIGLRMRRYWRLRRKKDAKESKK